ncbi:hypothetical protein [Piscibacillus halophilus]|uniref:Uncharacterized protein n=1 Tax=Piscibacillus halophilus TaxID=571933 RepID=A0A1H9BM65_9BACI|nr:hypothetical protein [Piscibacillus halophilus]SEP89985.1 hypothetical protein SAMN05216362_10424 [Piscibacillus halophilus]
MGLIEALFNNAFVLIALIAGLLSLFKKSEDNSSEERPVRKERPKPTTYEKTEQKPAEVKVDTLSRTETEEDIQIDTTNKWYEQLQESRERREQSKTDKNLDKIKQHSLFKKDQDAVHGVSIRKNLNNRRLIESLMMAEVLGKPKAKQNR